MRLKALLLLPAGYLLLSSGALLAQSACPPGQYQAAPPNQEGKSFCAPIPHDQQGREVQPLLPSTHWGAIATSENSRDIGAAIDSPNKAQAQQAALTDCASKSGSGCTIAIAYGNGCAALVASDKGYNAAADTTAAHAAETSMKSCADAGRTQCRVIYSACSPAQ